jgi:hypothetical protein
VTYGPVFGLTIMGLLLALRPVRSRYGFTERNIERRCGLAILDADHSGSERHMKDRYDAMVGWTLLGCVLTPVCFFFGVDFAGGGHGWLVPLGAALFSIVTGPVTGLAWALRHKIAGWWIALCLMFFEILLDIWLAAITIQDQNEGFRKVWKIAPVWVIAWVVLFLGHQLVAWVIVLFYRHFGAAQKD